MRTRRQAVLLLLPCLAVLVGLFVVPQALMFVASLWQRSAYGGLVRAWTLSNYVRAVEPLYVWILARSLALASPRRCCACRGWPVAYWLGLRVSPRWKNALLVLVDPALLDQLPRAHVRLDVHPAPGGPREPGARRCGICRRCPCSTTTSR